LHPFNGSLTIDPLDKSSDAGLYSCEARGQNGLSARQSLQLNILGEFFYPDPDPWAGMS
jgi:hypothetical protein